MSHNVNMELITELVSPKNREWASSLTPLDIATILDAISTIPGIKPRTTPANENPMSLTTPGDNATPYSETPALKGLQGENEFADMCKNLLSTQFAIINTSKSDKTGDFLIEWTSPDTAAKYRYLIDIKNYRTTVPMKEVEKFWRDIETNSSISGAILISLNSRIVGRKSVFQYEERFFNTSNIPCAYVCSNEPTIISEIIKFMASMSEIKQTRGIAMTNSEKVMSSIRELENSIDLFSRSRVCLQDAKITMEKQFNRIFIDLLSVEHVLKTNIKNILTSLRESEAPRPTQAAEAPRPTQAAEAPREEPQLVETTLQPSILPIETKNMIRHIWCKGDWASKTAGESSVEMSKSSTNLTLKFYKKHAVVIISKNSRLANIMTAHEAPGKITKKGEYTARLDSSTYSIVCEMCEIPI